MAHLRIRKLDRTLVAKLQARADVNGRSLMEEVKHLLEASAELSLSHERNMGPIGSERDEHPSAISDHFGPSDA